MRHLLYYILLLPALGFTCSESRHVSEISKSAPPPESTSAPQHSAPKKVAHQSSVILRTLPHDKTCYTQGLEIHNGLLYESSGIAGRSNLRITELNTGKILKKVNLPDEVFGEGLTMLNGKIFVLTWRDRRCLLYDPASLQLLGEMSYYGEGWGLTNDGESLIMTNGTNTISFISPDDFRIRRTISVFDLNRPLDNLNEVEYFNGEIWANVYQTNNIVRIDPQTGAINGWIDMRGLLTQSDIDAGAEVLNGIAYDAKRSAIYVTGKYWPKLFEIKVASGN